MNKETQAQDTDITRHEIFKLIHSLNVEGCIACNLEFDDDGLHFMFGTSSSIEKVIEAMSKRASKHLKVKIEPNHIIIYIMLVELIDAYDKLNKPDVELEALKAVFKSEYKLK